MKRTDEHGECLHDWTPAGKEVWTASRQTPGRSLVWMPAICRWCAAVRHVLIRSEEGNTITLVDVEEDFTEPRSGTT